MKLLKPATKLLKEAFAGAVAWVIIGLILWLLGTTFSSLWNFLGVPSCG